MFCGWKLERLIRVQDGKSGGYASYHNLPLPPPAMLVRVGRDSPQPVELLSVEILTAVILSIVLLSCQKIAFNQGSPLWFLEVFHYLLSVTMARK